jgi:hypothetical protein
MHMGANDAAFSTDFVLWNDCVLECQEAWRQWRESRGEPFVGPSKEVLKAKDRN